MPFNPETASGICGAKRQTAREVTKTEPVLGLNRFQGTRQASGEIGVLKCFFLYRTAEVGDGMPGKRRRSGSMPRRYRLFIGRAGSPRDAPLLDSKTVCCTAIRAAMQQTDFPRSNSVFIVQESG